MYYVEAGDGPPLVLLHPSPQSGRVYWRLIPRLAAQFRVVAFDTLGFGRSDPLPDDITMPRLGRATGDAMTALGIDRSHLFGFHTGNKIAAAIASQTPDRVGRLVLCGQTHSLIADQASRIAAFGPITDRYFESKKRKIPQLPTRWLTSSGRMRSSLTSSAYGGMTVPSKSSGTHWSSGDTFPPVSWIYWKPSRALRPFMRPILISISKPH